MINEDCPFISERTLRNFANKQRKRRPPPPPPRSTSRSPLKRKAREARFSGNSLDQPVSGTYTKSTGFIRGPPSKTDMPIYYFDPIAPPAFESGKYCTGSQSAGTEPSSTEVYEEVMVTDDEAGETGLKAPPLPDWAFTPGGPPTAVVAKKALVIPTRKGPRAEAEAPAPTGWQAVLAEMQRKKEQIMNKGNLKKIDPVEIKAAAAPQKKKGKKKKGSKDFKDVMDELSYKLAKLRGEIVEEDSDSDDSEEPPAPVKPTAKAAATEKNNDSTPAVAETAAATAAGDVVSTPKTGKKGGVAFADEESPAALPVRKLPNKESMMNLLSKVTKAPAPVSEDTGGALSRAKSAPNLAAMLSKRLAPPGSAPAPAVAATATPGVGKLAVPKPDSVPAPPPVPKQWPPVAHTVAEADAPSPSPAKAKKQKSVRRLVTKTDSVNPGKTVVVDEMLDLPEGYYMAAPVIGMVRPRLILPGGVTSAELLASLKLAFAQAAETAEAAALALASPDGAPRTPHVQLDLTQALSPHSSAEEFRDNDYEDADVKEWNELSPHQHVKDRLTVSDLPLPPDFHVAVQRMQKSNQKREALVEQQRDMELRSFLYYEKSDKINPDQTPPGSSKKMELTVPVEFVSHVDNHLQQKPYSHRKPTTPRSSAEDLPLNERISSAYKCPSTVYQSRSTSADVVTTYWVSNLRSTTSSPSPALTSPKPLSRTTPSGHRNAAASPLLIPPSYRIKTPQKTTTRSAFGGSAVSAPTTPRHALAQSLISPIGMNASNLDNSSEISSIDEQHMTPGAKYYMNFRPQTQPKAPKFQSDELLSRRQHERKEREERERQRQREDEDAKKQKKLAMKARAMQAAQEAGAYKASTRYHQHQKIFEKYNMRPDVGHNIEHAAQVAYAQYTTSHHLPPSQMDQLYVNTQQKRAAAASKKLHREELSQIQSLQREFEDYEDSQNRFDFSPNQRNNMLPY